MIPVEQVRWFAVQVMPRHEARVALLLDHKGVEQFLPKIVIRRQWSDRIKVIEQPLFPAYVFCRTKRSLFSTVLNTPGVHKIVSFGEVAYPIPDHEISAIQRMLSVGRDPEPVPYLTVGQKVIIVSGPLKGITGIVSRPKNHCRLIISVEAILRSISIEVSSAEVAPFEQIA
ncbi:transcription termination/antitermination protein NusG [Edaphobacter dinghuensis]|uniref:transcription termination/antitermination protein NusG n=1 Tax=Edaphobacter dinghuensis TaxID=1560005 RepID=UPI0021E04042|nr:UpxY family transcription antiterminator [Edaphobacter dinghuensis]